MAKGYFDIFSMESDNDEIDVGMNDLVKDETDVVEDAGSDTEVVDMNPSTSETSHNEEASAGGIATGSNQDDLEMDPVAASEAFIRRNFGLSVEDMEEVVEEKVAEAAVIPSADEEAAASPVAQDVADGVTTINIVPAEGTTTVTTVDPASEVSENVEVPIESESDVASIENLHKIFSREDGEPDESASGADVEFSVTTPNNSMDFEMEGKAVTIEPTGDTGSEPAEKAPAAEGEGEEQPAEGGEAEEGGEAPAEEGNDVGEEPEAGAESWRDAWTF